MKVSVGAKTIVHPHPVFVIGSYGEDGKPRPDGTKNTSLRLVMRIPSPAVSETVMAGLTAFMQWNLLQGGAVPPQPVPEDEPPVEAF